MQCDQKPGFGHRELTFVGTLEPEFGNVTIVAVLRD
jgi:hypothetical protein